jgi:transposase
VDPCGAHRRPRHHLARVEGALGRARSLGRRGGALALLSPPQDHAQKKTAHASEQDRPDIVRRRGTWFGSRRDFDPAQPIFIDETWASTNMARRYGRAPRGQRLRVGVPHGPWKTTTFVAGLRASGIAAPFVLDGPINRDAFEIHVAKVLVLGLKPRDVAVMDNLPSHKGPRVRELIEAAGARLPYLPPYPPDFNPIENAFAKLKALLRKAAERTVDGLGTAIGPILDASTPSGCANYFAAAGCDANRAKKALGRSGTGAGRGRGDGGRSPASASSRTRPRRWRGPPPAALRRRR